MTTYRRIATLVGAIAIASVFPALGSAHEEAAAMPPHGFQMAAVMDRARGNIVLAGHYRDAIEELGKKGRKRFEASTNLCVAYTMTGNLEKAGLECATALELSERSDVKRDIAVALSNLGVVKAVRGDVGGAQRDFSRALEISATLRQASDNLELLGAAGSEG